MSMTATNTSTSCGNNETNNKSEVEELKPTEHRSLEDTSLKKCCDKSETAEINKHVIVEKSKKPVSEEAKTDVGIKSKTDYLMQLLDKRKSLLSKMADIQPNNDGSNTEGQKTKDGCSEGGDNCRGISKDFIGDKFANNEDASKSVENLDIGEKSRARVAIITEIDVSNSHQGTKCDIAAGTHETEADKTDINKQTGDFKVTENQDSQRKLAANSEKSVDNKLKASKTKAPVTLHLLCGSVRRWMTQESVEYLNKYKTEESNLTPVKAKTDFDRQYDALVAKVDAQEKDFDKFLGKPHQKKIAK